MDICFYKYIFFLRISTYIPENTRDMIIPIEADAFNWENSCFSNVGGV